MTVRGTLNMKKNPSVYTNIDQQVCNVGREKGMVFFTVILLM
jgi:hypothetical protein